MEFTERSIQQLLAHHVIDKGHHLVVPNCGVFGHEADLISVTSSMYAHEYEIKVSRSDFKADAEKRKHLYMSGSKSPKWYYGPCYFWYVCPDYLSEKIEQDIPDHAGLMSLQEITSGYYKGKARVSVIKRAPRLHNDKIREQDIDYINRGLMLRFWKRHEDPKVKTMEDYYNMGIGTGAAIAIEKLEEVLSSLKAIVE